MNIPLTGVVRDVVVGFLFSEKPPLILHVAPKSRTGSAFVKLFYGQYFPVADRLFFFPLTVLPQHVAESRYITVYFFYKGRELYVTGELKRVKSGFAFVVPQTVFKTADISVLYLKDLSAQIYIPGFTTVQAECRLKNGYDPFNSRLWLCFSKEEASAAKKIFETTAALKTVELPPLCRQLVDKTKRILYLTGKKIPERNFFPIPVSVTADDIDSEKKTLIEFEAAGLEYDTYIPLASNPLEPVHTILAFKSYKPMASPVDVEEKLFLLPVCRFLSKVCTDIGTAWSRVPPLSILCLTHSVIILGGSGFSDKPSFGSANFSPPFPLSEGGEYLICIKVFAASVCRMLKMNIEVSGIYKNGQGSFCALCTFLKIQEEDRRFLYEKFYQTVYK